MCKGFIKIPRRVFEERQWNTKRVYSELDAICDIYSLANTRDRTEPDGTKIKRNQLSLSYRSVADKWLWNQMKVKRFIQALERKGYITVSSDRFKTIVTIIDFGNEDKQPVTPSVTPSVTPLLHQNTDKQRCLDNVSVTQPVTPSVTPSVTLSRAYKNDNYISCLNEEEKNIKKKNNKKKDSSLCSESSQVKSSKPNIEEIKAYCEEKGYNIDAEYFYNYYEANGWVQGKSRKPIKNWKACITTWVRNNETYQRDHKTVEYPTDYDIRQQTIGLMSDLRAKRYAGETEVRDGFGFPHESKP